jgi:hypothetical protein
MSETFSKVEVFTGVARRRRFTTEQKFVVANEKLIIARDRPQRAQSGPIAIQKGSPRGTIARGSK